MTNRFYNPRQYWSTCPSNFDFVAVIEYKAGGDNYFTMDNFRSKDHARLALRMEKQYGSSSSYKTYILSRGAYNLLLKKLRLNEVPNSFDMQEYVNKMSNTLPSVVANGQNLKNKIVHMAWNMTTGVVVSVSESSDVVTAAAQDTARENPTHQLLILSPVKKVYQPINIQVEDVSAEAKKEA
jgi:hypothetical protein